MTPQEQDALEAARQDVRMHYGLIREQDRDSGFMVYSSHANTISVLENRPNLETHEAGIIHHFDVAHARILVENLQEAIERISTKEV